MRHAIVKIFSTCVLTGALVLMTGGCASKYGTDLTPELDSFADNDQQDFNRYAKVIDNNGRQIWDDLARVLLLEETSELTRFPVP